MKKIALSLIALLISANTLAGVDIFPKRLVFEPGQRSAVVNLINNNEVGSFTYRVKWRQLQYDNESTILNSVNDSHEGFVTPAASRMLRYAPRQVTLKPGERQTVRVFLRRPKNQAEGEYRSHLLFEEQGEAGAVENESQSGFSMAVSYSVGMSIPVIVRFGKGDPDVAVVGSAIQQPEGGEGVPQVAVKLKRTSDYSSRVKFTFSQNINGEQQEIGNRGFTPLYTDAQQYKLSAPLAKTYVPSLPVLMDMTFLGRGDKEIHRQILLQP